MENKAEFLFRFEYSNSAEIGDKEIEEDEVEEVVEGKKEFKQIKENSVYYQPFPFRLKLNITSPIRYKYQKYPQTSSLNGYPHSSRNIQDIINYFDTEVKSLNEGLKFTGVYYMRPKNYYIYSKTDGKMMFNGAADSLMDDESNEHPVALNNDPFVLYKPKNPSDVNLLASNNLR